MAETLGVGIGVKRRMVYSRTSQTPGGAMKRPVTKHEPTTTPVRSKDGPASSRSEVDEIMARHNREAREAGWTKEYVDKLAADAFAHPEVKEAIQRERVRLAARRRAVGRRALQSSRGRAGTA